MHTEGRRRVSRMMGRRQRDALRFDGSAYRSVFSWRAQNGRTSPASSFQTLIEIKVRCGGRVKLKQKFARWFRCPPEWDSRPIALGDLSRS